MKDLSIVFSKEPFSKLSVKGRDFFLKHVKIISSRKGKALIKEGEKGDTVYFLLEGCCSVLVDTPKGKLPISHLYPPDFFGEIAVMDEFLSGMKRTATVENLTNITVAAMKAADFKELCISDTSVIGQINKLYKDRREALAELKERIKNI